jgi:hypothetical protein
MTKSGAPQVAGNRMCLDLANLPYTAGDAVKHAGSWSELVEFLTEKQIVSLERAQELQELTETDPMAANNLLQMAERLGDGVRLAVRAVIRGSRVHREWIEPINEILRVTEGHD